MDPVSLGQPVLPLSTALHRALRWLGSSSSMKGQGGKPEARFGRATALHTLAHFLPAEDAHKDAVLAAHRYTRKAIELQGQDGTYCTSTGDFDATNQCDFRPEAHCLAVLYAARLLTVCRWSDFDDVLRRSIELAIARLVRWLESTELVALSLETLGHATEAVLLSTALVQGGESERNLVIGNKLGRLYQTRLMETK